MLQAEYWDADVDVEFTLLEPAVLVRVDRIDEEFAGGEG